MMSHGVLYMGDWEVRLFVFDVCLIYMYVL